MTPSELTDAELDEAVARECFGWRHLTKGEAAGCGDILLPHHCTTIIGEKCIWADESNNVVLRECCDDRRWRPTSDARDAERVLSWLTEAFEPLLIDISIDTGGTKSEWRVELNGIWGTPRVTTRHDNWKRALCLTALTVARKEK